MVFIVKALNIIANKKNATDLVRYKRVLLKEVARHSISLVSARFVISLTISRANGRL